MVKTIVAAQGTFLHIHNDEGAAFASKEASTGNNVCDPCLRSGSNSIMPATKVFDHRGIPLWVHGIASCATNTKAEKLSHHNKHILLYLRVCRASDPSALMSR